MFSSFRRRDVLNSGSVLTLTHCGARGVPKRMPTSHCAKEPVKLPFCVGSNPTLRPATYAGGLESQRETQNFLKMPYGVNIRIFYDLRAIACRRGERPVSMRRRGRCLPQDGYRILGIDARALAPALRRGYSSSEPQRLRSLRTTIFTPLRRIT